MKIKLDENLGTKGAALLRKHHHDVATVPEQDLCGSHDQHLIKICHSEKRCLVTMDLDFANPLVFNPAHYSGIAVIRIPARASWNRMEKALEQFILTLDQSDITGKLWIVEPHRIREHQSDEEE